MAVIGQQFTKKNSKPKPIIYLCEKHYYQSDWSDKDVIITGRQSCYICKEK